MDHRRIAPAVITVLACALLVPAGARGAARNSDHDRLFAAPDAVWFDVERLRLPVAFCVVREHTDLDQVVHCNRGFVADAVRTRFRCFDEQRHTVRTAANRLG